MLTEVCVDSLEAAVQARDAFLRAVDATSTRSPLRHNKTTTAQQPDDDDEDEKHCSDAVLRLELCSALHQGGLTPSMGFVRNVYEAMCNNTQHSGGGGGGGLAAAEQKHRHPSSSSESEENEDDAVRSDNSNKKKRKAIKIELFLMIRCRAGLDFEYTDSDMDVMIADVHAFGAFQKALEVAGGSSVCSLRGIVFGALRRPRNKKTAEVVDDNDNDGSNNSTEGAGSGGGGSRAVVIASAAGIDERSVMEMCQAASANHFVVTFHRAVDYMGENAGPSSAAQFVAALKDILRINAIGKSTLIAFVLSSGGAFQSAAREGAVEFLDDVSSRISAAQMISSSKTTQPRSAATVQIIVGGGVNHGVVDRVRSIMLSRKPTIRTLRPREQEQHSSSEAEHRGDGGNEQLDNSSVTTGIGAIAVGGVHFSAKKVIRPQGVPDAETFWKFDGHLAEELFLRSMLRVANATSWSSL